MLKDMLFHLEMMDAARRAEAVIKAGGDKEEARAKHKAIIDEVLVSPFANRKEGVTEQEVREGWDAVFEKHWKAEGGAETQAQTSGNV